MERPNVLLLQILLAEKRTSLAVLRTGAAAFTLALSILAFVPAMSQFYPLPTYSLVAIVSMCSFLLALGAYLVFRSIRRIRFFDNTIQGIERESPALRRLVPTPGSSKTPLYQRLARTLRVRRS